jgi:origin recognition complex subunit 6
LPALVAVILLYVLARISDEETTPQDFMEQRDKAMEVLCTTDEAKQPNEEDMLADIDRFMRLAQTDGWIQMEWYLNIVAGEIGDSSGQENGSSEDNDDAVVGLRRRQRSPDVDMQGYGDGERLEIGLGTMMQEKLDYFSPERRLEYLEWKQGFLARIERLEREQALSRRRDEMEIDA